MDQKEIHPTTCQCQFKHPSVFTEINYTNGHNRIIMFHALKQRKNDCGRAQTWFYLLKKENICSC